VKFLPGTKKKGRSWDFVCCLQWKKWMYLSLTFSVAVYLCFIIQNKIKWFNPSEHNNICML